MKEYDFIKLFDKFISDTKSGKRLQKNHKRIRASSIEPYYWLRKLLVDFSISQKFPLRFRTVSVLKKRQLIQEKRYWSTFYEKFLDYLYRDLDCYDNYVGSNIKRLRAFFNYLIDEKGMEIGSYHKRFYTCSEEIEIITLLPEQLNHLIYDTDFEDSLPDHLKKTKDMFVFGCTVALRVSDIFKLTNNNLELISDRWYLKVKSQKTDTYTRIHLPDYAVAILLKQPSNQKTIFQPISNARFNLNIKSMIEKTGWVSVRHKTRTKRGVAVPVYKNSKTKEPYRFCDLITSHTMRKTAITTMLCLGMPENAVRKVSGHAANSKEFFKYVQLSQFYMDNEIDKMFELLKTRSLKGTELRY